MTKKTSFTSNSTSVFLISFFYSLFVLFFFVGLMFFETGSSKAPSSIQISNNVLTK